ncbi:ATP dependent DNA ligase [Gemmatirosa kalamazoonensis]|uniref:DNA ligase (ATP) n=1 Tax=Gemmatirosa kalamazoonensis TaxID=861299 RepID=W0RDF3_9BACT|nr:ATP-dependent DNA ligase [Gemmatirosa kalamazoonensis]AHG88816.1 ATP dependent DNA ligase [Gemmatirosa kalamazoonensis]
MTTEREVPVQPDGFHAWTAAADAVRATTKRLEKRAALAAYLATLDGDALAVAARFLSGLVFPRHDMRTTQVGGRAVFDALVALSGLDADALHARAVDAGELGDLARELFADQPSSGVSLTWVADEFARIAATSGSTAKRALVRELLASLGGAEAQYAVKLLLGSGELRIGLKEAQVEEAVAAAFGQPLELVRHANLLRGDVGEVAVLAREGRLADARLSLFHPLGFMLASPLATAEEITDALPTPFAVEDKYDGIRCQAHIGPGPEGSVRVALYSRTLDDITRGYPEVVAALSALHAPRSTLAASSDGASVERGAWSVEDGGLILDGELLAYDPADPARALPFKALQRRLGRKAPDDAVLAEVPVQFVAYDALAWDGALVIDEPYARRRERLASLDWPGPHARLAPNALVSTADALEAAFAGARAAGNEGIIAKSLASPYTPGRRGKLWVKLKKALATLDVVITGAERGHGRRAKVLSDYTFAVRASETDPTLLNVGKAYGGLTDVEIASLSERLHALTVQKFGRFHLVRPEVVLEVTFDIVQPSTRHKAGYALRFPRIVRIRDDKPVDEIDTLEAVRALAGG